MNVYADPLSRCFKIHHFQVPAWTHNSFFLPKAKKEAFVLIPTARVPPPAVLALSNTA